MIGMGAQWFALRSALCTTLDMADVYFTKNARVWIQLHLASDFHEPSHVRHLVFHVAGSPCAG